MDDGRIGDEMTLEGIAKQLAGIRSDLEAVRSDVTAVRSDMTAVRSEVTAVRSDVKSVDRKVMSLEGKVDSLDHKMAIEFEETRRVINLGFENVQMLDEKTGRRFDAADRKHDEEISLLKDVLRHVTKQSVAP